VNSSKLDPQSVRQKYNSRREIWPAEDTWHRHTYTCILNAVQRLARRFDLSHRKMLNLGSGGNTYGIKADLQIELDIADRHLRRLGFSVVGSAEMLPFRAHSFDFVLCVGSVLNYCDAAAAIVEIARVLAPGCILLLEFESSCSAEYLVRSEFGKAGVLVTTTFQGEPELLWLYNPAYVIALLQACGMELILDEGFHAITTLAHRFFRNEQFAMWFAPFDRLALARRIFRGLSCNRVLIAQKTLKSA
jgi:SAM-dependent methyltransferase